MSSRDSILSKIKNNQPTSVNELPSLSFLGLDKIDVIETYKTVLKGIGGFCEEVSSLDEVKAYIAAHYPSDKRKITTIQELADIAETEWTNDDPHSLQNVELAIVKAHFGVAENSALWVTDAILGQRVSPFIPQYLSIIVNKKDILPFMQQAYERIGDLDYGFGTFIAGPSKTADIEQSLVLGAHGARGLTVFLMN
ncbi:LutC/YkgG family protein [Flavobacterium commune]|uniref:Lactate utilization protein B/C n=1 Tax=Flavobacterium commune TaxID=1306519 RepID=A0A1D9PC37_9FLAO|nr:LUD domain-containing protein [Flavobacterium commune]APA00134.1 lactate utilization protein B/C [Flavobacterium commune]